LTIIWDRGGQNRIKMDDFRQFGARVARHFDEVADVCEPGDSLYANLIGSDLAYRAGDTD
jgi:hypothetical protein